LHSVSTYLNLTENWIEPQVRAVPGAVGRVLCEKRANTAAFPVEPEHVIVDAPVNPWHWRMRWPLLVRSRRRGVNHFLAELRVRRWKPDLIHGHFGARAWQNVNLARRLGVPLIASFYGYDAWMAPRVEPEWLERYAELFEHVALVLVEGPAMRDRLVELGCPPDRVRLQRIGVDLTGIPYRQRAFTQPLSVVMVGRFVEKKGLPDGLAACALALSRGVDLRVTIVGGASPDDVEGRRIGDELRRVAAGPHLQGRVTFTGFLTARETAAIVASHDIFLCPSRHAGNGDAEGGSPVALTEAMAHGAFCVGTRHCDIPEVILSGTTGYLVDEADVAGLARGLSEPVRDRDAAIAMTQVGRRHIEDRFAIARQLAALGNVYRSVAAGRPIT
jgi:colanic acid/amylovoran biosynthesis glycosyltransferase